MHVFAVGNLDITADSESSLCKNSIVGCGEKPTGGTQLAPVAKFKIFTNFAGPSLSELNEHTD